MQSGSLEPLTTKTSSENHQQNFDFKMKSEVNTLAQARLPAKASELEGPFSFDL